MGGIRVRQGTSGQASVDLLHRCHHLSMHKSRKATQETNPLSRDLPLWRDAHVPICGVGLLTHHGPPPSWSSPSLCAPARTRSPLPMGGGAEVDQAWDGPSSGPVGQLWPESPSPTPQRRTVFGEQDPPPTPWLRTVPYGRPSHQQGGGGAFFSYPPPPGTCPRKKR